jgi:hypothetical protein
VRGHVSRSDFPGEEAANHTRWLRCVSDIATPHAPTPSRLLYFPRTLFEEASGDRSMRSPLRFRLTIAVFACLVGAFLAGRLVAAEPTPPRAGMAPPRSGTTNQFGSGTITHRSDGTNSQTRPFGSGSITTERGRDGKTVTGHTQKFGSGTITRWSDGTTTESRPFGSGSLTTERGRNGQTVTGHTQKFGSGTITHRSDGSSSRTQPFGSGTLQRDQPGRSSGSGRK